MKRKLKRRKKSREISKEKKEISLPEILLASKKKLVEYCKILGLDSSGSASELRSRLYRCLEYQRSERQIEEDKREVEYEYKTAKKVLFIKGIDEAIKVKRVSLGPLILKLKINLQEKLDTVLGKAGIVLGILLVIASAIIMEDITNLGKGNFIQLGITAIAACSIYFVIRNRHEKIREKISLKSKKHTNLKMLILNLLFIPVFIFSLLLAYYTTYTKPISYFILISIAYVIVTVEIMVISDRQKNYTWLILLQILLIAANILLTTVYSYHNIVGIDPWFHSDFSSKIADTGFIPQGELYSPFAIYHSLVSLTMILLGLSAKNSLTFSISFIYIFGLVFVFLIGRHVSNSKTGLLGALIFSFTEYYIAYGGVSIIPMSLGMTLFSVIVFLVLKSGPSKSQIIKIVSALFMFILILTHTISAMICFVILISFFIGNKVYKDILWQKNSKAIDKGKSKNPVTKNLVFMFATAMIGYWMYATSFFSQIVRSIHYASDLAGGEAMIRYAPPLPIFIHLARLTLTGLVIIGVLFWCAKKNRSLYRMQLISFGLLSYAIVYLSGFAGFIWGILPYRWWSFIFLVVSTMIAAALIAIINSFKNIGKLAALSLIFIVSFILITSPIANIKSPLYMEEDRYAFEDSELCAAVTLSYYHKGAMTTDLIYNLYFFYGLERETFDVYVTTLSENITYLPLNYTKNNTLIIIREYIVHHSLLTTDPNTTKTYTSTWFVKLGYDPKSKLESEGCDKIYDCGTVTAYKSLP